MFDELLNGSSQVVSKSFDVSTTDAPNQHQQQHTTLLNNHLTPDPTYQVPTQAPAIASTENMNQAEMQRLAKRNAEGKGILGRRPIGKPVNPNRPKPVSSSQQNPVSTGQPNLFSPGQQNSVSAGQPNPVSAGEATLACNSIPLSVSAGDGILGPRPLNIQLKSTNFHSFTHNNQQIIFSITHNLLYSLYMTGGLNGKTAVKPLDNSLRLEKAKDRGIVDSGCSRSIKLHLRLPTFKSIKRIFKYLIAYPKLGLWYPRDSPFDLEAFSNSDYAGANGDRKSTTGGCQFLGRRDANEKKLNQVLKIPTEHNVADLLTKSFDVTRFGYLVVNIGEYSPLGL
nr:ribonuclease H-like domain, reverse transcriptase, RNA-dependent DNA polymerase [Tanacetum cinerariifolium]